MIKFIETDYITQADKIALAVALWVTKEIGVKKGKRGEKNDPCWKRRIDITNVRTVQHNGKGKRRKN